MKSLFHAARPIVSDMLSTLLFATLYAVTNNIYLSTAAAIALGVGQVAYEMMRGKPVPGMQWASLGLVSVLGVATLITGDARFVMIKPTVIYLTIGAAMMQRGWMERYMPPEGRPYIPDQVIVGWGYVWAGLMVLTAVANLVVAMALGRQAWLAFVGVFPLASKLVLFAINYLSIRDVAMRNARARESAGAHPQSV